VESVQPVARLRTRSTRARANSVLGWVRERAATTPGRLTLISVLVLVGALCFGVFATTAERSRAAAAEAARGSTEPLLVQAVTLYTSLSDANATATTTFLKGGLEPPARRLRYVQDLRLASDSLARLTREAGSSSAAGTAVRTITEQLPVYSGLVESARADNRQLLPVGAAYLRQASALLTGTILPEADHLYAIEAQRLSGDYGTGTAAAPLVVIALVACLAVGLLVVTLRYVARISRRILNVPILLATVLLAALSIWVIVAMLGEQNSLASARRASDSAEVLSATQVLLSRAQSDQSLTLVNRGSDETDPPDFRRVMGVLAAPGGLIGEAASLANQDGLGASASHLESYFAAYRAEAAQVSSFEGAGQIGSAINLASSPSSTAISDRLSGTLAGQTGTAQRRFNHAAADATSSISGLSIAIPVLTIVAAGLALLGLRQRLQEYR